MASLPKREPRCDGLYAKLTDLDGRPVWVRSIDCQRRETCKRYRALDEFPCVPVAGGMYSPPEGAAPADPCPMFIKCKR